MGAPDPELETTVSSIEKQPASTNQIDWRAFENDDEIKGKLRELAQTAQWQAKGLTKEDISKEIAAYIKAQGYPYEVSVTVSEEDGMGSRMIMGMAPSPKTGDTISF